MNIDQFQISDIELAATESNAQDADSLNRELQDAELLLVGGGTGNVIF
ncbi:MAG: hypothetical protein SF172_11670 [Burkholderiales bacterium]|nr:hypothetical protein [Burkholderiales bacterium]